MITNNPDERQELVDRLYAELRATNTNSDEFRAAFRYIQELEEKNTPPRSERDDLEIESLMLKNEKERAEIKKLQEPTPEPEKETFFTKHANVLIPAAGTFAGVVVIVCAEVFGTAILNSKAFNRLPKP